MSKGPSQAGNITQTSTNPTQQAQLPYLQSGWGNAQNLYNTNPYTYYPGQTYAPPNPNVYGGYQSTLDTAAGASNSLIPSANNMFYGAANGGMGMYNSPAYNGLAQMGMGTSPYEAYLGQLASGTAIPQQYLHSVAQGDYLNSNPYLDQMFGSASDSVTRAYQTATAPQTDSAFASAGRYGSGALTGAREQNQQALGNQLGNMASNIYGGNYQMERGRQDAASNAIASQMGSAGSALNSLMSGALGQMQGGYQAGNTAMNQMMAMFPSLLNANFVPGQQTTAVGQGATAIDQQNINDLMARFYGNQQAPWTTLNAYMNSIGQPTTGSNSTTSPILGPNPFTSALSTAGTGLSLYNGLNTAGLFGSSAAAAPTAAAVTGATTGLDSAAAALPFMATVICSELVRQKRMPRHWRTAGMRVFASYPEIARRGYYVWAIPSVRHLRRQPNSLYSRILCTTFNWRAEDIAARAGVKGARKLWRGRAVTAALALPCIMLGAVCKERDYRVVYDTP